MSSPADGNVWAEGCTCKPHVFQQTAVTAGVRHLRLHVLLLQTSWSGRVHLNVMLSKPRIQPCRRLLIALLWTSLDFPEVVKLPKI